MADQEPDWDALPDHPQDFFGLQGGFGLEELKRAYARLIRRFKPERNPEEFQRIRAAFEELAAQLRDAHDTRRRGKLRFDIDPPADPQEPPIGAPRGSRTAHPPRETPQKLLERLGAPAALDVLAAKTERTPHEWCALALLTEALTGRFDDALRLLVEGLAHTRGAPELESLLGLFLRELEPAARSEEVLVTLAAHSARLDRQDGYPAPLFWQLTRPLWPALYSRTGLRSTLATLAGCARQLGPEGRMGELLIRLELRRRAALTDDDEALAALECELAENLDQLPPWHVDEYDLVSWLATYRGVRASFRTGTELRERIDQALVAIIQGDEVEADRTLFNALSACLENRQQVLDEFPALGSTHDADLLSLGILSWYAADWRQRRSVESSLPNNWSERCADHLRLIVVRSARQHERALLEGALVALNIAPYCAAAGLASATGGMSSTSRVIGVALLIVLGILVHLLDPFRALKSRISAKIAARAPERVRRIETARFLAQTRIPLDALDSVAKSGNGMSPELSDFVIARDPGLTLISIAASVVA